MKKMFLKAALVALSLGAGFAAAENLLTYTATSKVSQKDADQKALEGVAKQMSTRVKSEFETRKAEDKDGNVSETAEMFKGSYTNVVLKGAKIVPGPKAKGQFQSTVTVDLDQLASKILLDLSTIRTDMHAKDSVIRLDMLDRDYRKMGMDMVNLEKLASRYNDELENLSCVQRVPAELKLESTLGELTEFLVANMSTLKIEPELSDDFLTVTVSDYAGPIPYFPVALVQDRKNLVVDKTDENGVIKFPMSKVKSKKASGDVLVHADMNFKFVRQSAVMTKSVSYGSKSTGCTFRLVCDAGATECGALQKFLTDGGIAILDKDGLPELKATMAFSDKANGSKTLYTAKATITLMQGDKQMVEQTQGVGRDAELAHAKAVTKLPSAKIVEAFGKSCGN